MLLKKLYHTCVLEQYGILYLSSTWQFQESQKCLAFLDCRKNSLALGYIYTCMMWWIYKLCVYSEYLLYEHCIHLFFLVKQKIICTIFFYTLYNICIYLSPDR